MPPRRGRSKQRHEEQEEEEDALPYDGDIQAAMRAEDRDAIRVLLAVNSEKKKKQERRSRRPAQASSSGDKARRPRENNKGGGKKWWKRNTDVDPISLEPLSELEYPPFECGKHYFDGQVLAFYLVSTGTFNHPMSRDPLTLKDCEQLDAYLTRNKLASARVADAFRLQQTIVLQGSSSANGEYSAQAETQRRHATAVLHSLFGFARYGDEVPTTTGASVAQALVDDQDDVDTEDAQDSDGVEDEGGGGGEEEEDFPALLTGEAEAATTISAQHQSNWVRETGLSASREANFPALPGGRAPGAGGPVAPHFRNAVTSYAVSATTERQPQQARRYEAAARAVADDFPELGRPTRAPQTSANSWRTVTATARPSPTTAQDELTKRQRERLRKREQKKAGSSAVARIREAAGEEGLAILREQALHLRRGEIDSSTLYDIARDILPRESFFELFSGLVNIIPDPDARRELDTLIRRRRAAETQQPGPASPRPPATPPVTAPPPPPRALDLAPPTPPPPPPPPQQRAAATGIPQQAPPRRSDFPGLSSSASRSATQQQQARPKKQSAPVNASWASALKQYGAKPQGKTGLSVVVPRSKSGK